MPIQFSCSECSRTVRAPDNLQGKRVKCPECQTVLTVPEEDARHTDENTSARKPLPKPAKEKRPTEEEAPRRRSAARRRDDDDDRDPDREGSLDEETPSRVKQPSGRTINIVGVIGICLVVVAMLFGWIPVFGFASYILTIPALILGLVGLIVALAGGKWGVISPVVTLLLALLAVAMPIASTVLVAYLGVKKVVDVVEDAQEQANRPHRELTEADAKYAQGRKAEAVAKYKEHFAVAGDKKNILKRIVEFEAANKNNNEADKWIDTGLTAGIIAVYDNPEAKRLAVAKYKNGYQRHFNQRAEMIKQIVEYEIAQGNNAEATVWVEKGVRDNLFLVFDSPQARNLHEAAKQKIGPIVPQNPRDPFAPEQADLEDIMNTLDRNQADFKYFGKDLTFSGVVKEIGKDPFGKKILKLRIANDLNRYANCAFVPADQQALEALQPGQQVKIIGHCMGRGGRGGNAEFWDCRFAQ